MSCNSCKKKKKHDNIISENEDYLTRQSPKLMWSIGIWFVLGLYGVVSLIYDLFSLL